MTDAPDFSLSHSPILVLRLSCSGWTPSLIETLLHNNMVLESEIELSEHRPESAAMHYLLGRALVRYAIFNFFPENHHAFTISQPQSGKPHLLFGDDQCRGWFSISHCENEIVVALSMRKEIGVDIEKTRHVSSAAIAHVRTAGQHEMLLDDKLSKDENFVIQWVLYEAYLKALGHGATLPIQSVKFLRLDGPDGSVRIKQNDSDMKIARYIGMFSSRCSALGSDSDAVTHLLRFASGHWLAVSERSLDYRGNTGIANCDVRQVDLSTLLESQMCGVAR